MRKSKAAEIILKVGIFLAAIVFAIYKIRNASDSNEVLNNLPLYWQYNKWDILIVILLMPLNWYIESLKWRFALKPLHDFKPFVAFKSVMSGVSIGLFTPNRIGEFGGRVMYLPAGKRAEGSVLSMISSYSQFFTTLLFGIPALFIFITQGSSVSQLSVFPIVSSVILALFLMLVYFNLQWVHKYLMKIKFLNRYESKLKPLLQMKRSHLLHLLLLSILRYTVFVLQFYFICRFFNLNLNLGIVLLAVANLYFLMSMLPMFTIGEPGLRASLTAVFFGPFTLQIAGVISASVLLWLINVLMVGILGAAFLFNQKLLNYESTSGS